MYAKLQSQNLKLPLERPKHGWYNNIKMDLKEMGCGGVDWIHMA
jgi:hypothetical protein